MTGRTPATSTSGRTRNPRKSAACSGTRASSGGASASCILFDGGKVVEVSTFRKTPDAIQGGSGQEGDDDLLIRSDNTFGTPEEDAVRRDFTINGSSTDIATYAVLDYVGAWTTQARVVRTIGDPLIRFVRTPCACCARASCGAAVVRHGVRLRAAIDELRREVTKSAAPRVTEEPRSSAAAGGTTRIAAGRRWGSSAPCSRRWTARWASARRRARSGRLLGDAPGGGRAQRGGERLGGRTPRRPSSAGRPGRREAPRQAGSGRRPEQILLVLEDTVNPLAIRMSLPNHTTHARSAGPVYDGPPHGDSAVRPAARRIVGRPFFPRRSLSFRSTRRRRTLSRGGRVGRGRVTGNRHARDAGARRSRRARASAGARTSRPTHPRAGGAGGAARAAPAVTA